MFIPDSRVYVPDKSGQAKNIFVLTFKIYDEIKPEVKTP